MITDHHHTHAQIHHTRIVENTQPHVVARAQVVGMSFFRQLLGDRNPAVAFHASRFLIDELQAERPEQYTAILNALLNKV